MSHHNFTFATSPRFIVQEKEQADLEKQVDDLKKRRGAHFDEQREVQLGEEQARALDEHSRLRRREEATASSCAEYDFKYADPERGFDRRRVKGTVAQNFRVRDAVNNTALEALAGGRLRQVIVDNEQTGMLLLTKGGLQRRVTLIPLNKIRCALHNPRHKPTSHQLRFGCIEVSFCGQVDSFAFSCTGPSF